jgi:hypothetical protein
LMNGLLCSSGRKLSRIPYPVLLRLPPHRLARPILHLEPIGRAAASVGRPLALRHDTLQAHLAGVREHSRAVAFEAVGSDRASRFRHDRSFQINAAHAWRVRMLRVIIPCPGRDFHNTCGKAGPYSRSIAYRYRSSTLSRNCCQSYSVSLLASELKTLSRPSNGYVVTRFEEMSRQGGRVSNSEVSASPTVMLDLDLDRYLGTLILKPMAGKLGSNSFLLVSEGRLAIKL